MAIFHKWVTSIFGTVTGIMLVTVDKDEVEFIWNMIFTYYPGDKSLDQWTKLMEMFDE